jgi:cysteinyl-tRNA synthetase
MATLTTTDFQGMVNAAFLQEVKESNPHLWSVLHDLRRIRNRRYSRIRKAREFAKLLEELRDDLALEFSLEETYGFVGGIAPSEKMCREARTAREQHRELYLHLLEICESVEECQYRGTIARDLEKLLDEFDGFDTALRAHEKLEADMIRSSLGPNSL